MSHAEQMRFVCQVLEQNDIVPQDRSSMRILEIGSYNVNGGVRALFEGVKEYVGVDLVSGPGVDLVSPGHQVSEELGPFDLVIATEVFEHDANWSLTLEKMITLLRPGGTCIVTCASTGRPEHGTERTTPSQSPGTSSGELSWYRNITKDELLTTVTTLSLWPLQVEYEPWAFDLYLWARKWDPREGPKPKTLSKPGLPTIRVRSITPVWLKILRSPIFLLARALGQSQPHLVDNFATNYWKVFRLAKAFVVGPVP
ncbi:hypothetical protein IMCC13023_03500 [Candidatus Aquiluna sp. IMCC13023]|uniref:class I SAM-dependent methyltransferase n=1 Tax=Candidatus Aquiluna sp. IMCC13023 TaxID=1081644 RepID=UPI00025B1E65|nr:methyltransferase domain-containing protein [Candidatus Aquiluna sp. IMCC13023]EIC91871.1 hypothetical protein IMCC13023_03500 [Candidatus Aquiluna sp. IMCC13023]